MLTCEHSWKWVSSLVNVQQIKGWVPSCTESKGYGQDLVMWIWLLIIQARFLVLGQDWTWFPLRPRLMVPNSEGFILHLHILLFFRVRFFSLSSIAVITILQDFGPLGCCLEPHCAVFDQSTGHIWRKSSHESKFAATKCGEAFC